MTYELEVLGGFRLSVTDGDPLFVRRPVQRLLALLAVRGRRAGRMLAASALWPDLPERRALANLRSVLWRCHREHPGLLDADDQMISLRPGVSVDYADVTRPEAWFRELLPSWSEEWLTLPRLLLRQTRLQLIEDRADELAASGRRHDAEELLRRLLSSEPERTSARRLLAMVAEGHGRSDAPVTARLEG